MTAKEFRRYLVLLGLLFLVRYTDPAHDVTLVLPRLIFPVQRPSEMKCVADEAFELEIDVETNIGGGEELTTDAIIGTIEPETWPGMQVEIPKAAGTKRFGAFKCVARDNETDVTSKVVGMILPSSGQAFSIRSTYRTNAGEPIELEVIQPRPMDFEELMWVQMSPGRPRHLTAGELKTTIEDPDTDHSGVYVVTYPTRDFNRRLYQQTSFRLLVRGCSKDKYGPLCQEECLECKNGGVCDMEDGSCICVPGFGGKTCEKICGPNKFGGDCQFECDEDPEVGCKGKQFCLPDPMGCTCASGFGGIVCTTECEPGTYGSYCENECHCLKDECDRFSGKCLDGGCSAGWTGENCQETCPPFRHGPNCEVACGACYGELSCNGTSGECPGARVSDVDEGSAFYSEDMEHVDTDEEEDTVYFCDYGYLSPNCDENCKNGSWWKDCIRECHCLGGAGCNPLNGRCFSMLSNETFGSCDMGWKGKSCDEKCPNGTYGLDCEEICGHCVNNYPCNPETGECVHPGSQGELCEPGFLAPQCLEICGEGKFGLNCSMDCNCHETNLCDITNGACEGHCAVGFTGVGCQERCPNNTFGLNCSEECGKCLDGLTCETETGVCSSGCQLGWDGDTCHNATLCIEYPCENNGTCEQEESIYRCHCSPGFVGGHCERKQPPCSLMPCQNQGMCMNVNDNEYICQCFFGYSGKHCEVHLDGLLNDDEENRKLYGVIAALAVIAFALAIVGIAAYNFRSEDSKTGRERKKGKRDCESGAQDYDESSLSSDGDKPPTMHPRKEGGVKFPRHHRRKGPPKTMTMKSGNRRISINRRIRNKNMLSDAGSCHLSRMTTNSLYEFYNQPELKENERGILDQFNQAPISLSNKRKKSRFPQNFHEKPVKRPFGPGADGWYEKDYQWNFNEGLSRQKNIQDSPFPRKTLQNRMRAINDINKPVGVPLQEYRTLVTQARDAEEEFDMEVRKDRKSEFRNKPPDSPIAQPERLTGKEYQRLADRAQRRSRRRHNNQGRKQLPKIPEKTGYPDTSGRWGSPFPVRNRVGDVGVPKSRVGANRMSESLNTRGRYRNSIPNVLSTLDGENRFPSSQRHYKNRRKSKQRLRNRHSNRKERGFDEEY